MMNIIKYSEIEVAFSISTGLDVTGTEEMSGKEKTPKGRAA